MLFRLFVTLLLVVYTFNIGYGQSWTKYAKKIRLIGIGGENISLI